MTNNLYPREPISDIHKDIENNYIKIRKSDIPGAGNGVFAKKDIPKGTELGYYVGEIINNKEFEKRYKEYGHGEYVLELTDPKNPRKQINIDAKKHYNWISRINAPKGTGKKASLHWDIHGLTIASRNIKAGEELLISYGKEYWQGKRRGQTRKIKK